MTVAIEVLDTPGDGLERARVQAIDWLGAHAAPHGVAWNVQAFALRALRDGDLVGVLVGSTNLDWLHVDLLSVDPGARKGGIGGALMARAEAIARARGCIGAWLDTYDFQAPDYYPRLGFSEFGRIDDMPPGRTRYFFSKRF